MVMGDGESAELPRLGGVCVKVCEREKEKREGLGEGLGALINLR